MADILGIDVSEHNGTLDWTGIQASGVRFAILRGGYGRYAADGQLYQNLTGAAKAGIPVGIYWFSYAISAEIARQEARKCAALLEGYDIQLPVFYDFEYDSIRYAKEQGVTLGKTEFNQFAAAFLEEIRSLGYTPGIYYNLDYFRNMVDPAQLGGYVQWFAQYAAAPSISDYAIWQYTSSGALSVVSGKFDLNILKDTSLLEQEPSSAGWKKDSTGWWYVHADGSYTKDGWEKIDGKWYCFDSRGYMLEGQWSLYHGNWYYLGSDGAMVTDSMVALDGSGRLAPEASD